MLISLALFKCLRAMILTLDPLGSSRRKVTNWTYLVAISMGMLTTLPSVHVNFSIVLIEWVWYLDYMWCIRNTRVIVVILGSLLKANQ